MSYADRLNEIKKKAQMKAERFKNTPPKPVDIADQDRPWSASDAMQIPSTSLTNKNEHDLKPDPQNFLESSVLGKENTLLTSQEQPNKALASNLSSFNPDSIINPILKNPDFSDVKTDNKAATNREQTDNKVTTEQATNRQQSGNNSESKKRNRQQSGNATGNKTDNKVVTKWQQTDNKPTTIMPFSKLVGLQREIVIFMCHECKNSRSRTTEALTLEYMENSLKHSAGAIKTTIQRLEKKSCLIRVEFKNGRGGWSRYELPDSIYHDVLRSESGNKVATKWQQTDNKVASQLATEPATSVSSSSSDLNIKETTTTGLGDEWNFDITPYSRFGFTSTQLKQLASLGVISAVDVEQSLIEFNHDLDNNALPPIKTTKINFLMGLLRAGHAYVSETFKNEQDAMILEMANRTSKKRESLLKAKFEAWADALSDEVRKQIENKLPTHLTVLHRAHGISNAEVRNWLFNYYLQLPDRETIS